MSTTFEDCARQREPADDEKCFQDALRRLPLDGGGALCLLLPQFALQDRLLDPGDLDSERAKMKQGRSVKMRDVYRFKYSLEEKSSAR